MKLVLIGGGEIGRSNTSYETKIIDEEIIKMSEKESPILLFIGLASSYSDSYYDVIKNNFKKLGCKTTYLKKSNLINNPDLVKQKFKDADIIYVGGGDTLKLLEKIKEYNLKPLLDEALNNNKVLAGISAGAILFSKKGYSDAYILRGEKETYEFISGLDYAHLSISPHYEENSEKTKQLLSYLKEKEEIYALEDGTAIIINNDQIKTIHAIPNAKIYKISYNNKLIKEEIKRPC